MTTRPIVTNSGLGTTHFATFSQRSFLCAPTVRLYALEHPWCKLNASDPRDVETFRQVLSERAHFWTVEVVAPPTAKYRRIIMDGAWSGDLRAAEQLLHDVAAAMPKSRRLNKEAGLSSSSSRLDRFGGKE